MAHGGRSAGHARPQSARERPIRRGEIFRDPEKIEASSSGTREHPYPARRPPIFLTVAARPQVLGRSRISGAQDTERRILRNQRLISASPTQADAWAGAETEGAARALCGLREQLDADLREYGNRPCTRATRCYTSRRGFDAHPAFAINGSKTEAAMTFVEDEFLPTAQELST